MQDAQSWLGLDHGDQFSRTIAASVTMAGLDLYLSHSDLVLIVPCSGCSWVGQRLRHGIWCIRREREVPKRSSRDVIKSQIGVLFEVLMKRVR